MMDNNKCVLKLNKARICNLVYEKLLEDVNNIGFNLQPGLVNMASQKQAINQALNKQEALKKVKISIFEMAYNYVNNKFLPDSAFEWINE